MGPGRAPSITDDPRNTTEEKDPPEEKTKKSAW
jgi:hypothetical protein